MLLFVVKVSYHYGKNCVSVVFHTRNNAIAWDPREPMNFTAVCVPHSN